MRGIFERLFAPSEEPSNDPRVEVRAMFKALKRRRRYRRERRKLMAKVRARAERSTIGMGARPQPADSRSPLSFWREHVA